MGAYLSEPEIEKISSDESNHEYSFGSSSMQGWRVSQEDAHNTLLDFDTNGSLFAVYDGHGGHEVAAYCALKLPDFLKQTEAYKVGNYEKALVDTFLGFDSTIVSPEVMELLKAMSGTRIDTDSESEDQEEEINELYKEASMPLEQLIAKYATNKQLNKCNQDKFQSPNIRPKKTECSVGASSSSNGKLDLDEAEPAESPVKAESSGVKPANQETSSNRVGDRIIVKNSSVVSSESSNHVTKSVSHTDKKDLDIMEDLVNVRESTDSLLKAKNSELNVQNHAIEIKVNGEEKLNVQSTNNDVKNRGMTIGVVSKLPNTDATVASSPSTKEDANSKSCLVKQSVIQENCKSVSCEIISTGDTPNGDIEKECPTGKIVKGKFSKKGKTIVGCPEIRSLIEKEKAKYKAAAGKGESEIGLRPKTGRASYVKALALEDDDLMEEEPEESDDESEDFSVDEEEEVDDDDDDEDQENNEDEEEENDEDEECEEEEDEETQTDGYGEEVVRGLSMAMREEPGYDSGCTACIALLIGKQLYVANVGDSRCVVSRAGRAVDMSIDHKPEDDLEMERIVKAGGRVTNDGRVNGGLNLSRAIGDHSYKQNKAIPAEEQMISPLPDVKTLPIKSEDEFVILACDGIWNSLSSQEACDFVSKRLEKDMKLSTICEELFDHCLAPNVHGDGTGCDNMTAIIIAFEDQVVEGSSASKRELCEEENVAPEEKKPRLEEAVQ